MLENLVPMVVMTGMFAMIFGIVYIRSRENMAMIERGLNPRMKDTSPRPFINLKWGLLLMGCGVGLLLAYTIDKTILKTGKTDPGTNITILGHRANGGHNVRITTDSVSATGDTSAAGRADDDFEGLNIDEHSIAEFKGTRRSNSAIYFALIAIGGGLGLFLSYRIEKKEWLDKRMNS